MHSRPVIGLVLLFLCTHVEGQGEIEKLPASVNTEAYDESSPVLSRDGTKLFFTRTADPDFDSSLPNGKGQWITAAKDESYKNKLSSIYSEISGEPVPNPFSSALNQDIWYAPLDNDSILTPHHPGYPINNALPNSLVSTGMYANEYVLLNEFYQDGSMYAGFSRVYWNEENQSFPEPMYIHGFNIIKSDVNMTMTPNGHVIILSVNGPGSKGERDLYVSFYLRENVWSAPVHMGNVLNSPYQETTPFISPDKRYLYFSSDRPGGIGGNDIYRSERLDFTWLNWSKPELVPGDVNSPFDDSQPYFDPQARYMYFSSRRDGSSDIFREHLFPKTRLKQPIVVHGRIINTRTGKFTRSEVFWGQLSGKGYLEYFNSYNGEFYVTLAEYEPYKFQLRKPNCHAPRILADPRLIEKQGKDTVEMIFYIQPDENAEPEDSNVLLQENTEPITQTKADSLIWAKLTSSQLAAAPKVLSKPSSFYDIYFLKSQPAILPKSERALRELTEELKKNPGLDIMVIGHTDNVGDQGALMELSERRAGAVKLYLVEHGIPESRIRTSGRGAFNALYDNTTESGREKNRRVEIKAVNQLR